MTLTDTDLVHVRTDNNTLLFISYLSDGNGSYVPKGKYNTGDHYNGDESTLFTVFPMDGNSDGRTDLLHVRTDKNNLIFKSHTNSAAYPDFLDTITDGLGVVTNIAYKPISDTSVYHKDGDINAAYPYLDFQGSSYVVSKTLTSNAIGGNYETNYTYAGAKLHLTGGGFLGFRQVTSTDAQTGIVTTSTYSQDYPNQGLSLSVEKKTASGQLLNQVKNTWQNTSLGAGAYHRSNLVESVEQSWDLNGAAMPRTKTSSVFDDYGNATKITVATDDGYTNVPISPYGNVKLTQNTYSNDTGNWWLGRLTRATVTSTLPSGASATRTSSFAYENGSGLLVQEVIEPDNADLKLVTDYTLDVFGNRIASTVSGIDITPRTSSTTYDAQGRFPVSSTNAKGHTETRSFDPAFGNPLSVTGPNGLTTTYVYDGFGRKTQENRPDNTQSTFSLNWCAADCPANAVYSETSTSSGSPSVTVYFDSLNRPIRSETVGFDGRLSVQDSQYDSMGRVIAKSRPYFVGDSVVWTQYQYDILGRVTQTTEPDGGISYTDYSGLTTTVTNALGQNTEREKNGIGQLVKTTDALNFSMLYAYDPFGNLNETTDPQGNKVHMDYDLRGRKIAMDDPDMGYWTYSYNVLGELVKQKNAKGQVTTLAYDVLGRMIKRKEPGLTSTWTWDTAAMGKGKLAKFTSNNGHSRSYSYDLFGRIKSVKTMIGTSAFSIGTQYDSHSRVLKTTYPTGFSVLNLYNDNGYLTEVRDAANQKPFWQATKRDATGQVIEESLGNGLITQRDFDEVDHTTGIRTLPFTGAAIQDLSLNYDLVGNLTNRNDDVINRNDFFGYDELNRLTSASYSNGKLLNLQYDELGNITSKSDVGSYSYGAKPHAVTEVNGTIHSAFTYDLNGNQIQGLNNRSVVYSSWDMPTKISQGGTTLSFAYDANHERFRQISPSSTTLYINPRIDQGAHFEQTTTTVGTTSLKESRHYIYAGSQVIGELVMTGTGAKTTHYFHSDPLGSIDVVTDDKGKVLVRYDYEPFGNRSPLQGEANTINHGFTGHEHLAGVGVIHMNGRAYDPVTARFLSADPTIQFPDNLQSYNRYSYVLNNPLAFTDPSGYGLFKTIGRLWHNQYVRTALAITAAAVTGQVWMAQFGSSFAFANSIAGGFVGGLVQTGNLNGAVHGAFSAGLFYGAGSINQGIDSLAGGVATHAVAGCISAKVSGGNCGQQALAAGFGEMAGPFTKDFGFVGNLVAHSVIGGTGSVLGGGKFANGAMTGAYGYLFNQVMHRAAGPTAIKGNGGNVAYVGGLGDYEYSNAVYDIFDKWSDPNATYFTHDQYEELVNWIESNDGIVTLHCHSYGADTCAHAVANGHQVMHLNTYDGVSLFPPNFSGVMKNSANWVNYNAVARSSFFDIVGGWGSSPEKYSNFKNAQVNHANIVNCIVPGGCKF